MIYLSICIPTFERCNLLHDLLSSIQSGFVAENNDEVEIIISDNCSQDGTSLVVKEFSKILPIKYIKQTRNIGGMLNVLYVPTNAKGKYILIIGDDDLIFPDAIRRILEIIKQTPEVDGIVACHAIEYEKNRSKIISSFKNNASYKFKDTLIKENLENHTLEYFEQIFSLTRISAPLNFIANVIFSRNKWNVLVSPYIKHCEAANLKNDSINWFGHMHLWAQMYTQRPVFVIVNPIVVGFVGNQPFLSNWDVLSFTACLDISNAFLKNSADKNEILKFKRSIYNNTAALARLINSNENFSKENFSLDILIEKYGDDPELWKSLHKAIILNSTNRIKNIISLLQLVAKNKKNLVINAKLFIKYFFKLRQKLNNKFLFKTDRYIKITEKLNFESNKFFKKEVNANSNVKHPIFLKNPRYLTVGENFSAQPGLRIEAWDEYRGFKYSPKIVIGDRAIFNFNCHIGCINSIIVGDDALIGSNVLITDHSHGEISESKLSQTFANLPLYSKGPVHIGNNVWIGENACILANVSIGDNCIIGCNSVVTKSFPDNSVIAGNPAKLIRTAVYEK